MSLSDNEYCGHVTTQLMKLDPSNSGALYAKTQLDAGATGPPCCGA